MVEAKHEATAMSEHWSRRVDEWMGNADVHMTQASYRALQELVAEAASSPAPTLDKPVLPEWEKLAEGVTRGPLSRCEHSWRLKMTSIINASGRTVAEIPWDRGTDGNAHRDANWFAACSPDAILPLASERDAAVARCAELEREQIVAPAECDPGCDDPHCPYNHQPLLLRQAYENAVSRLRAADERQREVERVAAGWHIAVEAICTIAGASCGLGASEAVEAVRTILDRDRTNLRHWRGEAGKLHARAEARLSEESPNVK